MSPPPSSSPSNSINDNTPNKSTSSPKLSARGTANHAPHHSLSGISAAKAALSRTSTHSKPRRPTLISSSSNAPSQTDSNQEELLEIERNKLKKLKTDYDLLLLEVEEREQESIKECQVWKSRADELSEQIIRFETDLVKFNELDEKSNRLEKELERSKSLVKDLEHRLESQNDEYDLARSQWTETENELKSRLTHLTNELTSIQKEEDQKPHESPSLTEGESGEIEFNRSPTFRSPTLNPASATTGPPSLSTLQLEAALTETKKEVTKAVSEAEGLRRALGVLREQLADAERVNEQLMDDNESYQFLVGERTLMGGFDIKQLLSIDHLEGRDGEEEGEDKNEKLTSGSELASVAEETEEEGDGDDSVDDIEKAVLESHGNGSRTTGAVEAEVINPRSTRRPMKKTIDNNATGGGGLDLAAELAQAEQSEETELKRKENEEKRKKKGSNGRPGAKDKDAEIKFLTDANKALVLYISKILDRIQAHEGFERVLAHDYKKEGGGPNSPSRKIPAPAPTTATTPSPGGLNSFFNVLTKSSTAPDRKTLNLASAATTNTTTSNPSRASWLQFFTASKSPPAAPTTSTAGIKPLKLGTGNAGLSSGWQGLEEDEEDIKERERLRAELKLHGIDKSGSGSRTEAIRSSTLDTTTKANRRGSSVYDKRMSADHLTTPTSPPVISPAGVMKRSEEREKESKSNLEKGQASGFTEIEIRGSRLRPSVSTRQSGSGHLSPTSPSFNAKILGNDLVNSPPLGPTGGNASGSEDGILAKAAKRITLMRS
ncbi:hypothetical protein DFH28DRAFT_925939 [Melampsora americana]|nr:hypothetical protein DFH28DRAFT_925939 [Melampsora americana]